VGGSWVFSAGESNRNDFHHTLYIIEHFVVPKPEHPIAASAQKFGSSFVGDHLSILGVATAVNFNDEPVAGENGNRQIAPREDATTVFVPQASSCGTAGAQAAHAGLS
jgi:hypothetical protein